MGPTQSIKLCSNTNATRTNFQQVLSTILVRYSGTQSR